MANGGSGLLKDSAFALKKGQIITMEHSKNKKVPYLEFILADTYSKN